MQGTFTSLQTATASRDWAGQRNVTRGVRRSARQFRKWRHPADLREDLDDIGTTVTAFMAVSADPPLVCFGLTAASYVTEAITLAGSCALTILAADHSVLASRFAAAGRPSARLLLDDVPHDRAAHSGALVVTGGLAALDCSVESTVVAGDHVLVVAPILEVVYVAEGRQPLIRHRSRYRREL